MADFQKQKKQDELSSILGKLGLALSPDTGPAGAASQAMGPGVTAPADWGELPALAPRYLPPAPAGPVATENLDGPDNQ